MRIVLESVLASSISLDRATARQKINDQNHKCHDQQQVYQVAADATDSTD
jgi:hypothetical protein